LPALPAPATPGDPAAPVELLTSDEKGHREARVFERAAWRAEIYWACERIRADPTSRARVVPAGVSGTQLSTRRCTSAGWDATLPTRCRP
ncbi:hypothetical protein ACFQ08_03585, partial [Streptosporangium algeriense]